MIYGYARVSTDGQSVTVKVAELRKHGAGKVFREVASGAKTDRAQLRRVLDQLDAGDVLMVTRLQREPMRRDRSPLIKRQTSPAATDTTLEFGRFRVLSRQRQLLAEGVRVDVGPRAFALLMVLIEAVSKPILPKTPARKAVGFAAGLALAMLSFPVHAAPAGSGDIVQGLYDALLSTMKNGQTLGQSGRFAQLEAVNRRTFDIRNGPVVGRLVLGHSNRPSSSR